MGALATLLLETPFAIFVRRGYKKDIGEPFIKESIGQTWTKELLFVVGVVALMWSFMSMLDTEREDIVRAGYQQVTLSGAAPSGPETQPATAMHEVAHGPVNDYIVPGIKGIALGPWNWGGVALVLWGLIVLIPFRVLAQHYQRHAVVEHMAAVIVPTFSEPQRQRVLAKLLAALHDMPLSRAAGYMRAMLEGLDAAGASARTLMATARVRLLAEMPAARRDRLMDCMAGGLAGLHPDARIRAMGDMMGAVGALPEEKRLAFMAKMTSLIG